MPAVGGSVFAYQALEGETSAPRHLGRGPVRLAVHYLALILNRLDTHLVESEIENRLHRLGHDAATSPLRGKPVADLRRGHFAGQSNGAHNRTRGGTVVVILRGNLTDEPGGRILFPARNCELLNEENGRIASVRNGHRRPFLDQFVLADLVDLIDIARRGDVQCEPIRCENLRLHARQSTAFARGFSSSALTSRVTLALRPADHQQATGES